MRVLTTAGGESAAAGAAATVTASGGVIVFPTDTVYGIGCRPDRPQAVERIFALKGRPRTKPLVLHVDSVDVFERFAAGNDAAMRLARAFLPGALTVIVKRPADVGTDVTAGFESLGLRVPDHAACRAILAATGPLAATSANLSGRPAYVGGEVPAEFPNADLLIDDGATTLETESTVIDVSQERPRVVRAGAVGVDALARVLEIDLA